MISISSVDPYDILRQIVLYLFTGIGYFGIFRKCGVKGIWAFVPMAREYHMGLCADKESEGKKLSVITGIVLVSNFFIFAIDEEYIEVALLLAIATIALIITEVIFHIRILIGLTKVFNRSKWWVWPLWLFESITTLLWGYSSKFQPSHKVDYVDESVQVKELGTNLKATDQGLSVNIKERSTIQFFKKKVLLKDIHMNIPKGHMVLLLGGSGAGKTTFVNAVTGYEKAKAEIKIDGSNVYKDYSKMLYDIGFVPQQDLMRENDTAILTLSDAASLRLPSKVKRPEIHKRIKDVMAQFGLSAASGTLVEKMSGGQKKRLSIAMEYISDPSIFILDEPDSGLDGIVARSLFTRLREIADQNKIVIVITHTPDRVADLFDDVIVLAKDSKRTGRLAWYGPIKEAYEFFGKDSMEGILSCINPKDAGGEGRGDEFVEKYAARLQEMVG
ncbi:ATP-binding cassette domain-containing protein [Butyrivibrio proteoclasticus]|uniref:ATP-binding cassette domain-containing protein n=1 Tax=Butyrivibrio proteoclasticus TaxID=43305 RepID=UPI0009DE300C|nr:ABC transporter ATP-binding protein [Butyrivibrio proteoclasticus]